MKPKHAYILIITETVAEANQINQLMPHKDELVNVKFEAFAVCSGLRGLRFKAERPTVIIEKYTSWNERIERWRKEVVLRLGTPNTIII